MLVVDDEPVVEMLAIFLRNRGYRIVTANTGVEALTVVETHPSIPSRYERDDHERNSMAANRSKRVQIPVIETLRW